MDAVVQPGWGEEEHQNPDPAVEPADPEVSERAQRRHFDKAYKLRILEEADQCRHGELGALLRREGLYASSVRRWRRQRAEGRLDGKRRQTAEEGELVEKLLAQEQETRKWRERAKRAEAVVQLQKKLCALLGLEDESGKS